MSISTLLVLLMANRNAVFVNNRIDCNISSGRFHDISSTQLVNSKRDFAALGESALAFCAFLCQLATGVFETTYKKKEPKNAFR